MQPLPTLPYTCSCLSLASRCWMSLSHPTHHTSSHLLVPQPRVQALDVTLTHIDQQLQVVLQLGHGGVVDPSLCLHLQERGGGGGREAGGKVVWLRSPSSRRPPPPLPWPLPAPLPFLCPPPHTLTFRCSMLVTRRTCGTSRVHTSVKNGGSAERKQKPTQGSRMPSRHRTSSTGQQTASPGSPPLPTSASLVRSPRMSRLG